MNNNSNYKFLWNFIKLGTPVALVLFLIFLGAQFDCPSIKIFGFINVPISNLPVPFDKIFSCPEENNTELVVEKETKIPENIPTLVYEEDIALPEMLNDYELIILLFGQRGEFDESFDREKLFMKWEVQGENQEYYPNTYTEVETSVIFVDGNWDGKKNQYIVLTRTNPPDCCGHAGLPVIGGAVLVWQSGKWNVKFFQENITQFGSFGKIEDGSIETIDIGPNKSGLLFHGGYAQSGHAWYFDFIFAEINEKIDQVFDIITLQNNMGDCPALEPCWENGADFEFIPGENPDFYEIKVTKWGTDKVDDEIVRVHGIEYYIFIENIYVKVE